MEETDGQEHRILVGDVGDGVWGELKKEVSFVFLLNFLGLV